MELVVGRVAKAHGITGEIVVDVRTDDPDARFVRGKTLRARASRGGSERTFTIASVREHGGRGLVRFTGVGDGDARIQARDVIE